MVHRLPIIGPSRKAVRKKFLVVCRDYRSQRRCTRVIAFIHGCSIVLTLYQTPCYTKPMLLKRYALLAFLVLSQTGCAVYTVASTTTLVTTQKSIGDHTLTLLIPNSDCNALNILDSKYYCEIRDIGATYNRNGI